MTKDTEIKKNNVSFFNKNTLTKIKHIVFGSKKRGLISLVVFLVLIFAGWKVFAQGSSKPQYQTAQVTKGTIISSVTESGNVTTNSQGGVGSPTTGIIEQLYVKDGDSVTQGQNLFKVKSTATAQEIASAYATYESSVVSANNAAIAKTTSQATLEKDRATIISASSAVTTMQDNLAASQPNPATKQSYTQNDIDVINSALTSAQETFAADQSKYTQSDQSIAAANAGENSAYLAYQATQDSVVTAPINGTVANISVQSGDEVTASSGNLSSELASSNASSTGGSAVLSIGNFSSPYIKVQASEVDIPTIKPGQKATITLNAYSGETFVGTVSQVDTVGTITSGVVTYNVYVGFVAAPSSIEPGMSATVTIETARKDDVLSVPSTAIQTSGGQATVQVLQNGTVTSVPVTTGISSDTDTEITSGLSEGQNVVTGVVSNTPTTTSGTSPFSSTGLRGGFGGGFGGGARGGTGGGAARSGGQ